MSEFDPMISGNHVESDDIDMLFKHTVQNINTPINFGKESVFILGDKQPYYLYELLKGRIMGDVKVLFFDLVGTLFDWRGSIVEQLGSYKKVDAVATEWVRYYATGSFKYGKDLSVFGYNLVQKYHLYDYVEMKFLETWTNLTPWPDVKPAFDSLRTKYKLVALTNLTTETVVELSKNSGIAFDFIYSAELTGVKKPAPIVYQKACEILRVEPSETMLVAAHRFDLKAAKTEGMQTCYIERNDDSENYVANFNLKIKSLTELSNDFI
jgi:2-haloacid dehalogenase